MKTTFSSIKTYLVKILLTGFILFAGVSSFSQVIPELIFKNPTHTGTDGAVGTVYKFASVATGIDALVKISDRSSSLVTLSSIDLTSSGYTNAFQPQVSYNDGDAPKNTTWWMEFTISFVKSTNNTVPVTVGSFDVTALDMDGDDATLREQLTFFGLNSYTLENPTSITVANTTNGKIFTGSTTDYTNINTNATNIMVTTTYANVSGVKVRVGGTTGSKASTGTERMSSLWFKSFTYNNPANTILPVQLLSFTARKDNKNVVLDWSTSTEINFSYFTVQRSTDGNSFTDITTVLSDGNNSTSTKSYSYTDMSNVQSPVSYYRLKMVDKDAQFKYSEVRTIRNTNDQDQAAVVVYPNPAISELRVTIPAGWQNKKVAYSIYNSNGVIMQQKLVNQASQTETISLAGMKSGMYIIKAATADQSTVKQFNKLG